MTKPDKIDLIFQLILAIFIPVLLKMLRPSLVNIIQIYSQQLGKIQQLVINVNTVLFIGTALSQ